MAEDQITSSLANIPLETRPIDIVAQEVVDRLMKGEDALRYFLIDATSASHARFHRIHRRSLQLAEYCIGVGKAMKMAAHILGTRSHEEQKPLFHAVSIGSALSSLFDAMDKQERPWSIMIAASSTIWQKKEDENALRAAICACWPNVHTLFINYEKNDGIHHDALLTEIETNRPTVLLIAHPTPHQEAFISCHWHRLKRSGVRIVIAGGRKALFHVTMPNTKKSSFAIQRCMRYFRAAFSPEAKIYFHECATSFTLLAHAFFRRYLPKTPEE